MPLGLTATARPGGVPRVDLTLTWDIQEEVTVLRRDPDRSRPVRGAEPAYLTAESTWAGTDYEAPFGVPVVYEMVPAGGRPDRLTSGAVTLNPTAWYPNDLGWSTERGAVWLRHLTIPDLSMPIDLANAESLSFKATRTVLDVLNRRSPLVLTDARRKNPTTTYDVRTWSLEEGDRLRELLADNSVLLLTVPAGERWGIRHEYVAVGDVTEERLWQEWAPFEGRVFHLPCEVVDRPAGGSVAVGCTYWSVQRGVPSYLALKETYATYADVAACRVRDEPGGGGYTQLRFATDATGQGTYSEPTVVLTTSFDAVAGRTYRFSFQQFLRNAVAPVTAEVRYGYQPGDPSSGYVAATTTRASIGSDALILEATGDFEAFADETVQVALVVRPMVTAEDATSDGYLRTLTVGSVT